jgi:hypothetical protein
MQYGVECWAGDDATFAKALGSSNTACTMKCPGAADVFCGGPDALNLYTSE